ncbi:unnamed protein product [Caenorhabditis bovis]|uniref:Protein AATF n=1 Tax=Caenorhabditis bovis TaxID=2654633 RepID=A0A8S1F1V2_9PELO|nr:unnamed protein product [Caenorhabditis bovis]
MSFLDEISKLTTPAAELPDVEDDDYDGTKAKKSSTSVSKLRPKLDFEEGKYSGKRINRADLFGDSSEMSGLSKLNESESDDDEEFEGEDEEEEEDDDNQENQISKNGDQENSDDEEMEDEENESGNEDEEDEEDDEDDNTGITKIHVPTDNDATKDKAECIRNQRKVWEDVMYTNIRMHALLNSVNQLPRGEERKKMLNEADDVTKENLNTALQNLGKLRKLLKEAVECFNENSQEDDDDEEIPSDDEMEENDESEIDDEEDEGESDDEEKVAKGSNQGVSIDALSKFLAKHDTDIDKFRATTITKWYNRTKLLSSKSANNADFSVFEKGSILNQISKILNDEGKLLRKVRTNRGGRQRMGLDETNNDVDDEIFDDTDFYQFLLKQMIEARSSTVNTNEDGADMTRSYMELQKMFNNKKKRDVTSLSSKDRRLKYEPIARLINFYPANPAVVTWSHESRNELFKSLFN